MATKPPFFAKKAAPGKGPAPFEKSAKDKESPRFGKEGSKKEEAMDRKQMAAKGKGKKPTFYK